MVGLRRLRRLVPPYGLCISTTAHFADPGFAAGDGAAWALPGGPPLASTVGFSIVIATQNGEALVFAEAYWMDVIFLSGCGFFHAQR